MKKLKLILVTLLWTSFSAFSQNIELKDNIAYVDEIRYLKIEKVKKNSYIIRDIEDDSKLLKIKLVDAYNRIDKKTHRLPQVYSYRSKRKSKYEINIKTEHELIEFIYTKKLVPLKKYIKD